MSDVYHLAKAGAESLLKPVADIIDKVAGPAAEEFGLALQDHVKAYRLRGQVRLWQRTREFLDEAGIDVHPVAPKLLLPIIDYGSVEDDAWLRDRWAALLANAAIGQSDVLPAYPEILRHFEVRFRSNSQSTSPGGCHGRDDQTLRRIPSEYPPLQGTQGWGTLSRGDPDS
jgi:hypothetical protein